MNPKRKSWTDTLTVPFEVKADLFDDSTGSFEGYLSVFGNLDLVGDIVEPGAFTRTIEQNKGVFPLLWFHDPYEPVGMFSAQEDSKGLYIKGQLDLNTRRGAELYSGLKMGYIRDLSIGYKIVRKEVDEANGIRRLQELALREGSLLTANFAANPEAQVTSVKHEGETMSAEEAKALRDERDGLERQAEALTDLLASVPVTDDGALSDETKAELAATLGVDLFAPEAKELPTDGVADVLAAAERVLADLV
ncbi:MAG: HK97 family phage prohead protease [Coriobacteriales bacterium]|nr:HK97 family phage prohead protease [Actinomycetes bacterium]